jgi:dihydroorotate dehydrogenase
MKIQAGASLVQLYSSFALHGPALIPRLKADLLMAMRDARFATVQDAVGTRAEELAA